jgi:hypothetical protein
MNFLMNFTHKAKILFIISLFLSNCSKVDPATGEKILIETNPNEKAKKALLVISEHLYRSSFVVDQEINFYSCIISLEGLII